MDQNVNNNNITPMLREPDSLDTVPEEESIRTSTQRKVTASNNSTRYLPKNTSPDNSGLAKQLHQRKTKKSSSRRSGVSAANQVMNKSPRELLLDSMIWGVDKVASDLKQGLPKKHIEDILAAIEERGYPFGHRPIEALCKTPLEEGNPTKPFAIKGKSSNFGLQQSFICVDQKYSKLHGQDEATLKKYNGDVANIDKEVGIPAQLKISHRRIEELLGIELEKDPENRKIIQKKSTVDKDGVVKEIEFEVLSQDWVKYKQKAEYNPEDGYWYIYNIIDDKPEPLNVICHPETKRPITADVDPLFEAYPWEEVDLAKKDKLPVPLIAPDIITKRIDGYEARGKASKDSIDMLRKNSTIPELLKAEDNNLGNVSPRAREMIDDLGGSKARLLKREHPLIHHNFDASRPFSSEEENYPATIYFPKKVLEKIPELKEREQVVTVTTGTQLKGLLEILKDNGYFMYLNPLWKTAGTARSTLFTDAQKKLTETFRPWLRAQPKTE